MKFTYFVFRACSGALQIKSSVHPFKLLLLSYSHVLLLSLPSVCLTYYACIAFPIQLCSIFFLSCFLNSFRCVELSIGTLLLIRGSVWCLTYNSRQCSSAFTHILHPINLPPPFVLDTHNLTTSLLGCRFLSFYCKHITFIKTLNTFFFFIKKIVFFIQYFAFFILFNLRCLQSASAADKFPSCITLKDAIGKEYSSFTSFAV